MHLIHSVLTFLTTVFAIISCLYQRRIICATLMAVEEIPHIYKTDAAAHPSTRLEHHIFTLPLLPPVRDKYEVVVKSIMTVIITSIVWLLPLAFLYTFGEVQIQLFVDAVMFSAESSFKIAMWNTLNRLL